MSQGLHPTSTPPLLMTQPNLLKLTKKKLPNLRWYAWFPYPSSWLKAFVLILLMSGLTAIVRMTNTVGYVTARIVDSPSLFSVFGILALLSPIAAIAFAHHFLHLFINQFFPSIQAPEVGKIQGLRPGLLSWWEGLYGWLAIVLATLITLILFIFFLPLFNLSYNTLYVNNNRWSETIQAIIAVFWISSAAFIYQIDFLMKQRLISIYSFNNKAGSVSSNLDLNSEIEVDRSRGDIGITKMRGTVKPKNQSSSKGWQKHQKTLKNLLIISLIPLVAAGSFWLGKWSESRENIPLAAVSTAPSPVLSEPIEAIPSVTTAETPETQIEPFQQAVNKAMKAAKLTQTAQFKADWDAIVSQWQEAIALMKAVPLESANYQVAQKKAVEYQSNLAYAKQRAANSYK
ncbi:hypothetical protein [Trichocoleus sp. DQ-U1]|uniref:hypothetical protein n=1 Tax=Trichocoleus sp. DQ-U1 TaxID=2933926 RepID=UPI0032996F97